MNALSITLADLRPPTTKDRIHRYGFTGTHHGMSNAQLTTFTQLINFLAIQEFHHGDCVGADMEADRVMRLHKPEVPIIIHPPIDDKLRAFCGTAYPHTVVLPTKPYIERNHDIVKATRILIAAPHQAENVTRSGTWATIRYALSESKTVLFIQPDGKLLIWQGVRVAL